MGNCSSLFLCLASMAAGCLAWPSGLRGEEPKPEEPPPVSPFAPYPQSPPRTDARPGVVTLSDGTVLRGLVMLTRGRKLEIFEDAMEKFHQFDMAELSRIEAEVEFEKEEKEWRWKEGGSDVKIYTGRSYVDRRYRMRLTLADGKTRITGHVRGTVFYVQPQGGEPQRFFLQHDQRGEYNQKPAEMVYVRSVVIESAPAPEAKAAPEQAGGEAALPTEKAARQQKQE
jgi:hypothetical protein